MAKFSQKKQKEKEGLGYGRRGKFPNSLHPPKTPGPFCLLLLSWKLWGTDHFNETLALIASSKRGRKIFKTLNSTWSKCKCTHNCATIWDTGTDPIIHILKFEYVSCRLWRFFEHSWIPSSLYSLILGIYLSIYMEYDPWYLVIVIITTIRFVRLITNWYNWVSRWISNFFSFLFPSFFSSRASLELEFEHLFCFISFR